MINVELKGDVRQFEAGVSAADVAKSIGMGLYKSACAAKVNGEVCDLRTVLNEDCTLEILTFEDEGGKQAFWHTAAHVMAQAVQHLFPGAKFAIGPAMDNGFYYDIEVETPLTTERPGEDRSRDEEDRQRGPAPGAVRSPARRAQELRRPALQAGADRGARRQGGEAHLLQAGRLHRPVRRPPPDEHRAIKAVKLTSATGAYWRGDAHPDSSDRVYGIAFPKASELEEYLKLMEEAKKRDHRRLGKELELFTLLDEGPGFPFFLPKGMVLKNTLIDYWREIHREAGYQEISTPIILSRTLWERSGHWDHYKNNMYTTVIDDTDFAIKPMNCPGGMLVYQTQPRSYRDLPLRMGELGLVHRHELSGALHGLMRVRCFTQDDAHIFMTPEQIKDEIKGVVA